MYYNAWLVCTTLSLSPENLSRKGLLSRLEFKFGKSFLWAFGPKLSEKSNNGTTKMNYIFIVGYKPFMMTILKQKKYPVFPWSWEHLVFN